VDLRELVGQLFVVDFTGQTPTPEVVRLIERDGVGGVILFDKNIASPRQIAVLTNTLQEIAAAAKRPPLLVSADQEGGPVVRLREGATHFPSAMAFGAAASAALVASAAGVTARELRAVGIRMNLAPVLDVNNNPANPTIGARSFGEHAGRVGRLGAAAVHALQASGVLATAKHFPGHGDTSQDSHLGLPVVPHTAAHLEAVELPPFRAAIAAGVGAVMTAHVLYPALDADRPATLSPAILGMLRGRLGFAGLIVTDSMAMRAITDRLPPGEAAVQALLAGADVILACGTVAAQEEALEAVRHAVDRGRISHDRIAESASRVRAAKRRLGLMEGATVAPDGAAADVGVPAHLAVADHVAKAAATLLGDGAVPLPAGRVFVLERTDEPSEAPRRLAEALRVLGRETALIAPGRVDEVPDGAPVVVVVGWGRVRRGDGPVEDLARAVLARGPVAAVCVGAPYALARVPRGVASVVVYGDDPPSLRAAAAVLAGTLRAPGRLPVSIVEPGEPGPEPVGQA